MLWTIIGIIALVLFLVAAFEILTGPKDLAGKVIWLLVILLLPYVGVALYFFMGRGK